MIILFFSVSNLWGVRRGNFEEYMGEPL